jgi:predicted nucleotidyltransferase component of viral defense system
MIEREEIESACHKLGVQPPDIQRDYLYGWLLAGIYSNNNLHDGSLVLKGGNAFRKGYFVSTRFSGDLDFAAPTGLDSEHFLEVLNDACRMAQAHTGVRFDLNRNAHINQRCIDKDKIVHKYSLYFQDFYGHVNSIVIALRIDVTEFGRIYLPVQNRHLIHPYSDKEECKSTIAVVSLEEALADKLKCLIQRTMSNDLFDLVYSIFVNNDIEIDKSILVGTFLRKTIFESSPPAALQLLLATPFEIMKKYWDKIVCAPESRLEFSSAVENFKGELQSMFSSFQYGETNQLAFFPAELRTPILIAGRSKTLIRMEYDGVERLVEPYSLAFKWRKGGVGQEYLYVWDQTGGRASGPGIKSLFNWKISKLENTSIRFDPRFEIELAKAGELGKRTDFNDPQAPRRARSPQRNYKRPRYQVRCAYCQREFPRTTPSTVMRPHKDKFGNRCPGKRGYRI